MALVRLDYINIGILNPALCGEIFAEIGERDGLIYLALHELLIVLAYGAIGIRVTDQETKLDISVRLSISIDILRTESYNLGRRNSRQLCRHAIPSEGNGSYRGRAAHDLNLS